MQKSESFLNSIFKNIPNMIFVKDAEELRFVRINQAGEKLTGLSSSELLGKNDYDFFPKEQADFFVSRDRKVLESQEMIDIPEEKLISKHKGIRILHTKKFPILDEHGNPRYICGISEDITEQKKMTEHLRQSQKIESIGRLAGGIAHDFNNMLSVISGYTDLALSQTEEEGHLNNYLKEIRKAAARSASLTYQLLAFAKKQESQPISINLNESIQSMLKMLQSLIGENINLEWTPGKNLWPIKMDPSQLDQIVTNLCVNARDAIASTGLIHISTKNINADTLYCRCHPDCRPGTYVQVTVSDTGCGMDDETKQKIFEPFFSTKGPEKGTGLGLATLYGAVRQNHGFVNVYSEVGKGTTFQLYFPKDTVETKTEVTETRDDSVLNGTETILVVEDVENILSMVTAILTRYGYTVIGKTHPFEALEEIASYKGNIDMLITDVIMPDMNGRELAKKISSSFPDIKQLFMSGYTDNIISHHGAIEEGMNFIQKPFSLTNFIKKVRSILDS